VAQPDPFRDYLRVQKQYDAKVMATLERAAKDIQTQVARLDQSTRFSATVRKNQLRAALAEIRAEQMRMWQSVGNTVQAGRLAGAVAAQDSLDAIANVAYTALPRGVADDLVASLKHTARAGIDTAYARTPRTLSTAVYNNAALAAGKVEDTIVSGIQRGLSAREMASEVYKYISPTTPGGASYAAMRLSRTEINNAFHNQQILSMDAPGVKAAKWNLSNSHPKPDECNAFADEDRYDLGAGCFPTKSIPQKPHPQCFCYLSAVTMEPGEFTAKLKNGDFDDELRRRYKMNVDSMQETLHPPVPKPAPPHRPPAGQTEEERRKATRAAARAKSARIEAAKPVAQMASDIDTALRAVGSDFKTRDTVLRQSLRQYQDAIPEGKYAEWSDMITEGRYDDLRTSTDAYTAQRGLSPIGKAGDRVRFDERRFETFEGVAIPDEGDTVVVARRGWRMKPGETDDSIVLDKAIVKTASERPALDPRPVKITKGTDLSEEFEQTVTDLYRAPAVEGNVADDLLTAMGREQGFTDLPGIGSAADLDEKISQGWTEVFRGVKPRAGKTAEQVLDILRGEGEFGYGTGASGNGIYTSVRRETGLRFALTDTSTGESGVVRMAISPKAKVVKHADLLREQEAFMEDWLAEDGHDAIIEGPRPRAGSKAAKVRQFYDMIEDEGRFAMMRGYDVIKVEGRFDGAGSQADQWVVLNRTIMMIEDAP
jgi:hypothetical protein